MRRQVLFKYGNCSTTHLVPHTSLCYTPLPALHYVLLYIPNTLLYTGIALQRSCFTPRLVLHHVLFYSRFVLHPASFYTPHCLTPVLFDSKCCSVLFLSSSCFDKRNKPCIVPRILIITLNNSFYLCWSTN